MDPEAGSTAANTGASGNGKQGGPKAAAILAVFSLHNAWNCWVFLNFTNFGPAEELLGVGDAEIGFITTVGWLGILSTVPLVTVCTCHRMLLAAAGLLNVVPPVLRYFAALHGSYKVVALTNFLQGGSFGVLGAWPAMLAALQWPEERRTLVTAVASLSNYVGGAAGVLFMPAMADTKEHLLDIFYVQAWISGGLFLLMGTWLWIPPVGGGSGLEVGGGDGAGAAAAAAKLTLGQELRLCLRPSGAGPVVLAFGVLVGVSLLLQGMNQFILAGVGYSDLQAGAGNTVYQLAAALVGVGLGSRVTGEAGLRKVLPPLHAGMVGGLAVLGGLCAVLVHRGSGGAPSVFPGAVPVMVATMGLLGATLMGMLPFCLQQAVYAASPASENVVSGLIYLIAMLVAAGGTQLVAAIDPLISVGLVVAVLLVETSAYCFLVRPSGNSGGSGGDTGTARAVLLPDSAVSGEEPTSMQ
jgi:hypothetical protein